MAQRSTAPSRKGPLPRVCWQRLPPLCPRQRGPVGSIPAAGTPIFDQMSRDPLPVNESCGLNPSPPLGLSPSLCAPRPPVRPVRLVGALMSDPSSLVRGECVEI